MTCHGTARGLHIAPTGVQSLLPDDVLLPDPRPLHPFARVYVDCQTTGQAGGININIERD